MPAMQYSAFLYPNTSSENRYSLLGRGVRRLPPLFNEAVWLILRAEGRVSPSRSKAPTPTERAKERESEREREREILNLRSELAAIR